MEPKNKRDIKEFENFHILLWLLKDVCWVSGYTLMGTIMIVPTVSMALYIAWATRHIKVDLFHNLAVVCWITANSIWMLGEMYFDETPQQIYYEYSRNIAFTLFLTGIGFVIWYHLQKRISKK
jgi:drug/metabolite transporter (DMT)-like permease